MSEATTSGKENKSTTTKATKGGVTGGVAGAAKNAAQYIIQQGGTRWYNGVNIFDKTVRTAKGYPKWFARIDYATPKNPVAHINVNRAVTGLKDPHIAVSNATAQNAAKAGTALNYLNKAAPVLTAMAVAYDGYQIGKNVVIDKQNGSTRNTTKKVVTTAATWGGGWGGAAGGAVIGTSFFPGVGTLIGGLIGGIAGGIGGSIVSEVAADAAMDAFKYDITFPQCKICSETFECRIFETGEQMFCGSCRENNSKSSALLPEKKNSECGNKFEGEKNQKLCNSCNKNTTCTWCGSASIILEKVQLEEESVELCEICIEVLKKEIRGILDEDDEVDNEVQELEEEWICKNCETPLEGSVASEGEDDLVLLCKDCRENIANEILMENEKTVVSCKWCDEDFICESSEEKKKNVCPDCEEKRPKKGK